MLRKTLEFLTIADKILLFALAVLSVLLFYAIPGWVVPGGTEVEIRSGNLVVGRYSLDRPRTVEVPGPLGKTLVQIAHDSVRVIDSPCRNKLCVKCGAVDKRGGIIACIPNGIVIKVGKGVPLDLDAVTP